MNGIASEIGRIFRRLHLYSTREARSIRGVWPSVFAKVLPASLSLPAFATLSSFLLTDLCPPAAGCAKVPILSQFDRRHRARLTFESL